MNYLYKSLFLILLGFIISGCTGKHLTVKSLQPSLMHDKKIYNIILEDFTNDHINQANHLEEKLVNVVVEGKRVFNMQTSYNNIDAIVTGEVIDSSFYYDFYYTHDTDYRRCWKYEHRKGKRTSKCLEYREIRIPCEKRTYTVKTKVQVLNQHEDIIFSKFYTKSKNTNECFRHSRFRGYSYPYNYGHLNIDRRISYYHSLLAKSIAAEVIKDISPHYIYQNISIIEELEDKNSLYSESIKKEFDFIVELLDNGNIDISQTKLHKLNMVLNRQSYEVLYNLALTYEANNQLFKAKEFYEESKYLCNNIDNLKIINSALNRTQRHLEDKIRAKSQLP